MNMPLCSHHRVTIRWQQMQNFTVKAFLNKCGTAAYETIQDIKGVSHQWKLALSQGFFSSVYLDKPKESMKSVKLIETIIQTTLPAPGKFCVWVGFCQTLKRVLWNRSNVHFCGGEVDLYDEGQGFFCRHGVTADDTLDLVAVNFSGRYTKQRADCGSRTIAIMDVICCRPQFVSQNTREPPHLCRRPGACSCARSK